VNIQRLTAVLSVVLSVVGCNRSPYELAPVRGRVTIDGLPLSSAKVMFAPSDAADTPNPGKPAFGLLSDDGSFALTTYEDDDGAVVGEHWVTIVKLSKDNKPANAQFDRLSVPRRVNVAAGQDNQIDIQLSAEDVARYGVRLRD
jgi:hypothetical protein